MEAGVAAVYGYEYLLKHVVNVGTVVFNGETNVFFGVIFWYLPFCWNILNGSVGVFVLWLLVLMLGL